MPDTPDLLLCFGEILWDFLPAGLFLGGAPFNVAYHMHRQGGDVRIISALGADTLGDEVARRMDAWQLSRQCVARHQGLPTGFVRATLGEKGDASYDIVSGVAWDQITSGPDSMQAATRAAALVFGSLALRTHYNRDALERLLVLLPTTCLRVFDVNLRPPFDDLDLVRALASKAGLLKLNSDEAARLAGDSPDRKGAEESHARRIAEATGCTLVCVTAAERGAGLLREDVWHWSPGRPVKVADTIGAGDAFLATLVTRLVRGNASDAEVLAHACRMGEWVASQSGATPAYGPDTPRPKLNPNA